MRDLITGAPGSELGQRLDRLEAELRDLRAEVDFLGTRVRELESVQPSGQTGSEDRG